METITYIALLRAINVGGRFVKMERLRALFGELSFTNVRSYIQSGNIFFETAEIDRAALTAVIETKLHEALGYDVTTILRTVPEFEAAIALDPFRDVEVTIDTRLCISFLASPIPVTVALPVTNTRGDYEIVARTSGETYIVMRLIDGKMANPFPGMEKTFGVKSTTRFYGTAIKILEAAKRAG